TRSSAIVSFSAMSPKARNQPDHLQAPASPRQQPATRCQRKAPPLVTAFSPAVKAASASTQKQMMKMSSMAMRACTKTTPSNSVIAAENNASATSEVSASVHSQTPVTVNAPNASGIARQPKGLSPNSFIPAAISILASGG